MATFVKINDFVEHVCEGVHDFSTDNLEVALSDTAPGSETNNPTADGYGVLANVTQISYTNLSSRVITTTSSSQTGGTYKLVLQDLTLTASGTVAQFRYVYIFNQDAASDQLIAHYDYGSEVNMSNGETFQLDFDDSNGLLQIA